ncbi:MAG TPA: MFS transporter [Azospira sp.]|nr:MFS transporter [Azospira sp.]
MGALTGALTGVPPAPAATPRQPLAVRQWLAYGVLGLPLAMAALPVYVHVPQLYAGAGIDLALLGALLLAVRLLDAGIDPLLGRWSDRAARRQGLIVVALPFLALGMLALLHPPAAGSVPWLVGALLVTYFGFSLASIAYQAWGAELGRDAGERTLLTASREGFGLLGVVLASLLPLLLAGTVSAGLSRLAWLFLPLLAVAALLTLVGAPPAAARPPAASAPPALRQALGDPRFVRLLAVFVANGIAAALPATLVLFFVADVLRAEAFAGAFLALYFVAGVGGLPLWVRLARRLGRVRAWLLAMAVAGAAFVFAATLGAGDVWAFAAVCAVTGLALGADLTLPAALLADIAGSRTAKAGAGAYFGWWNLVAKLNLALAAGLALPLLAALGYRPGEGGGLFALALVYGLLPLAFKLLAGVLAWRWRQQLEEAR